jgi:hypothetical protein
VKPEAGAARRPGQGWCQYVQKLQTLGAGRTQPPNCVNQDRKRLAATDAAMIAVWAGWINPINQQVNRWRADALAVDWDPNHRAIRLPLVSDPLRIWIHLKLARSRTKTSRSVVTEPIAWAAGGPT